LADRAIELLTSHKALGIKPFFVAVGFIRPHVDWSAPQWAWDLYDESELALAKHKLAPPTSPKVAWVDGGYVDHKTADVGPGYKFQVPPPTPTPPPHHHHNNNHTHTHTHTITSSS